MFAASHIASGSLVFDGLKDERKLWVKLPLAIVGMFAFHWVLDSTQCFHELSWPYGGWEWFIIWFQVALIAFLWAACAKRRWWIPPSRVLWGAGAWLILDWEWIANLFGRDGLGIHRALFSMFDGIHKSPEVASFVCEALFIGVVVLISLPAVKEWWKSENSRAVKVLLGLRNKGKEGGDVL